MAGEKRMGFFALRAIAKGTDLTFDYQFERQVSGRRVALRAVADPVLTRRATWRNVACADRPTAGAGSAPRAAARVRGWEGLEAQGSHAAVASGGADESDGESEEPVEEQSFDEYEDDDVLGIGDTLCVPYAPMQHLAPLVLESKGS